MKTRLDDLKDLNKYLSRELQVLREIMENETALRRIRRSIKSQSRLTDKDQKGSNT